MRTFQWLYGRAERDSAEVVSSVLTAEDLAGGAVVVRDEKAHNYRTYASADEYWIDALGEPDRLHHEVVFACQPQRLKLDIDMPAADLLACLPTAPDDPEVLALFGAQTDLERAQGARDSFLRLVLERASSVFCAMYGFPLTAADFLVFDSSGPAVSGFKFSHHVLVAPFLVAGHREGEEFTAGILELLEGCPMAKFIDAGVNKSTQNFRTAGSTKAGRTKVLCPRLAAQLGTGLCAAERTLVAGGLGDLRRLGAAAEPAAAPAAPPADITEPVRLAALKVLGEHGVLEAHEFDRAFGGLLLFRRRAASMCGLCARVHESDNTLMVALRAEAGEVVLHELCRHKPNVSRPLGGCGVEAAAIAPAEPRAQVNGTGGRRVAEQVAQLAAGERAPHEACLLETMPGRKYSEETMRAYELVDTLVVRAQMKCGKTRALRVFIDSYFPQLAAGSLEPAAIVRLLTFRRTFTEHLRADFPDFGVYSDRTGAIGADQPRMIVQVESLHRIQAGRPGGAQPAPDLVVLDEVESILDQFDSGLHKNFELAFANFEWLLASAKHVVCMDANVGDRTLRLLQKLRPGKPITFHWNSVARGAGETFEVTCSPSEWHAELLASIGAGRRVAVASNSIKEALVVAETVRTRFPNKRLQLYSSKTSQAEKDEHFADVHKFWAVDVLIYTPTVSAGVSFELTHFDEMFGFFNENSCSVESSRQMMGRVRNLARHRTVLMLPAARHWKETGLVGLARLARGRRCMLVPPVGGGVHHEFDPAAGVVREHLSPYYQLWLDNMRMRNLSFNRFAERLIDQVADTGARLKMLEVDPAHAALGALRGEARMRVQEAERVALAAAPDLSPDAAQALENKTEELTPIEKLSLAKWRVRLTYQLDEIPGPELLAKLSPQAQRLIYKNLCRIMAEPTLARSAESIRNKEYQWHINLSEIGELTRRYVFPAHYLTYSLLYICGFLCLLDRTELPEAMVRERILASRVWIRSRLNQIAHEFDATIIHTNFDGERFFDSSLRLANTLLRRQYGVEIKLRGTVYLLRPTARGALVWPNSVSEPRVPCALRFPSALEGHLESVVLQLAIDPEAVPGVGPEPLPEGELPVAELPDAELPDAELEEFLTSA